MHFLKSTLVCVIQWTLSTLGTNQSVLIRGVASIQGELVLNLYYKAYLVLFKVALIQGWPYFT